MSCSLVALLLMVQSSSPQFPHDGAIQVFDNEQVTIWDVTWEQGEPAPVHEHRLASLAVTIQPGRVKNTLADRTTRVGELDKIGSVHFRERGLVHGEEGISDTPRRAFLIEIKEATLAPDPIPDGAVPAWPREEAKKILENDFVIVWDYTFAADLKVPLHYHDRDQIIVSLASGKIRMIPPHGEPRISEGRVGRAVFVPRGALHREEYVAGTPRAIAVQLKR